MKTPSVGFADTSPGGPGETMGVVLVDLIGVYLHVGIMCDADWRHK